MFVSSTAARRKQWSFSKWVIEVLDQPSPLKAERVFQLVGDS